MKIRRITDRPTRGVIFFLCVLFMSAAVSPLFAENPVGGSDARNNFLNLSDSIDQAVLKEKETIGNYGTELAQIKERQRQVNSELAALKVQSSIYSNLLIIPETQVKNLEQAFSGNLSALTAIHAQLSDFKSNRDRVNGLLLQSEDQIRLNSDQLKGLIVDNNQTDYTLKLIEKLKRLLDLLNKKKDLLGKLFDLYDAYFNNYAEIEKQFGDMSASFDSEIKNRRKQDLFQRKKNILFTKNAGQIMADMVAVVALPGVVFTRSYWEQSLGINAGLDYSSLVIMGLLFVFLQYVLFKIYKSLPRLDARIFFQQSHWARIALSLIKKSLFLTGNSLFLLICDYVSLIRLKLPLVVVIEQILTVILLSRWMIDILTLYPSSGQEFPGNGTLGRIKRIIRLIRLFACIYIVGLWTLDADNILLVGMRIIFAAIFYIKLMGLSKNLVASMPTQNAGYTLKHVVPVLPVGGTVLMFTGMILDLSGYTQLAVYMATALGRMVVAVMWSGLFFTILRDFKKAAHLQEKQVVDDMGTSALNAHWFLSLIYTLIWFAFSIVAVIYVWGGKQAVVQGVYIGYTTPIHVGNMSFSLMGFSVALVLLLITHGVARVWRELFQKRLLNDSGMDIGVQESITTITVYLIWIAGIFMALNVFGVNMTSITVVLGALGIGLGFGLQNIFNNFLSGIILLFERPIQVGDDVEINGTWASVKKINVRSTVVQTYDNATLIIPNSDFISNQVTNWSFKDKRLRRNIVVGVAYGSDLELVRKSMIDAAEKTPRVLKLPKPDVIFKDFGDNALIFVLRIWTRVEYFYTVESAIRFEIDRLFREGNIEIAFPQMDLHLRSLESDLLFRHADMNSALKPQKKKKEEPSDPQDQDA